jgi:hypothetical protein
MAEDIPAAVRQVRLLLVPYLSGTAQKHSPLLLGWQRPNRERRVADRSRSPARWKGETGEDEINQPDGPRGRIDCGKLTGGCRFESYLRSHLLFPRIPSVSLDSGFRARSQLPTPGGSTSAVRVFLGFFRCQNRGRTASPWTPDAARSTPVSGAPLPAPAAACAGRRGAPKARRVWSRTDDRVLMPAATPRALPTGGTDAGAIFAPFVTRPRRRATAVGAPRSRPCSRSRGPSSSG